MWSRDIKLINSEWDKMKEKQIELNKFMIAFNKILHWFQCVPLQEGSHLSVKKHSEASVLRILKFASALSMHMWSLLK